MPRDARLFMTFPNDFWKHPKVAPLSDAAFRAFVEMNGYSRTYGLDGKFQPRLAEKLWDRDSLAELVASHDERPLVYIHADGDYVLRDYAEHQETTASIAARQARNIANGRKGGRPRRTDAETDSDREYETDSVSESGGSETDSVPHGKAEVRVQSDLTKTSSSQSRNDRASGSTDSVDPSTAKQAAQRGITSLPSVVFQIRKHARREVTAEGAHQVALSILDRKKDAPASPQRYVTGAIRMSPFEVQQYIDEHVWPSSVTDSQHVSNPGDNS